MLLHWFWKVRLVSTLALIPLLSCSRCVPERWRLVVAALGLLILDMVDSVAYYIENRATVILECKEDYQRADKIVDQVQYGFVLLLLLACCANAIDTIALVVLVMMYALRWIGVALFVNHGSIGSDARRWLTVFPDVTKELLLLLGFVPAPHPAVIAGVVVAKTGFEIARFQRSKMCDTYRNGAVSSTQSTREMGAHLLEHDSLGRDEA